MTNMNYRITRMHPNSLLVLTVLLYTYVQNKAMVKRSSLSLQNKTNILPEIEKSVKEHGSKMKIALKFNIPKLTLSTIVKNKDKIMESYQLSNSENI